MLIALAVRVPYAEQLISFYIIPNCRPSCYYCDASSIFCAL